ncbi:MAG: hypothetical protein ACD_78C00321G0002 [uncultured bacterium (gcode 4)]|uniref:Uncharacterized protein n=1 Tax=uncultured bacterium (gcode 4) TaxID=1234023 RepID=K1YWN2_9BACT|nr:MAG: hypothetical protein ACD_78C00321G0002 [uncultured bacterium (gcode 4)]
MKLLKNTNLYSRLALITSVTLVVGYFVVYAAWTTINPVNTWDMLTTTLINNILGNLTDLNDRVSNFGFSSGNVGIGTASPSLWAWEGLYIKSNTQPNAKIILEQWWISGWMNFSNTSNWLYFNSAREIGFWPQNINTMTLTGGNVWIWTTTPAAKLHVAWNMRLNSNTIRQIAPQVSTVYTDGASAAYWYCSFAQGVLSQAKAGCTVTLRQNAYGTAIVSWWTMVDSVNYIYRIYGAYTGQVTCMCMEWE